uniref:FBA_2 domain-containing protein n=1 Tax=Caenorhabditis tropicalis TaxID=1561998 RepID=A0A1I7TFS0_9PELO
MNMLSLVEITMLSMCSKRTRRLIKAFCPKRDDMKIAIYLIREGRIHISNDRRKEDIWFYITSPTLKMLHSVEIGDSFCPISLEKRIPEEEYSIYLFFEDKIEGLKTVSDYLCSFFEVDNIHSVYVNSLLKPYAPQILMEWILNRQERLYHFMTECKNTSDTVAENLLDKCRFMDIAHFNLELTPNFKTSFEFGGACLSVKKGHWLTIDNLLNINCLVLNISGSILTSMEMNVFLKHWMTTNLWLRYVSINMNVMVQEVLFSGIPVIQQEDDFRRDYRRPCGRVIEITGGFDITRNDGTTATIIHDGTLGEKTFCMVVWNNE